MSLTIKNLVAGYGESKILHEVSMRVEESKVTGIIGPNGAGKSTLLKSIFGLTRIWAGHIFLSNEDITGSKPHTLLSKGISFLLQRRNVFPYLTVHENLEMGTWIFRRSPQKANEAIEKVYNRFPILKERRNAKAGVLSGGEQRMLELGRALMVSPKILLVDEFSTGLAPKIFKELYVELMKLNAEEGLTIVAVDQNVREIMSIADYIYVLELGQNKVEGSKEEFKGRLKEMVREWLRF